MTASAIPTQTIFRPRLAFDHGLQAAFDESQIARRRNSLAIGLIALLTASCGIQGPVRPPRPQNPAAITDLKVSQVGPALFFKFTIPQRTAEGQRLTKPFDVEIYRATGGKLSARGSKPWWAINASELGSYRTGNHIEIQRPLEPKAISAHAGKSDFFQVATLVRGFRGRPQSSALSNVARVQILDVPAPPSNLTAHTTKDDLILAWIPPTYTVTGALSHRPSGYVILMSHTGAPGTFAEIGAASKPRFRFAPFNFGTPYVFKVRALVTEGQSSAQSANSLPVAIVPRNTFPPAAPEGLSAIAESDAVALIWRASPDPALAGYNVYRRTPRTAFTRLNHAPLRAPVYRDRTVKPHTTYFYAVSAVDEDGNESPKSSRVETGTREPNEK